MNFEQEILQALIERDTREKAMAGFIAHQTRLSNQMITLRDRNRLLLKAAASATTTTRAPGESSTGSHEHPVQAAYIVSLEAQITSLRDELAGVYKTSARNSQRLLTLNENLREAEEKARAETEHLREAQADIEKLRRRIEEARTLRKDKEKNIEHLTDELATLQLEYSQLENRNEDLQNDNKALLQRWLDHMQNEAHSINEANAFLEQTDRLRASVQSPAEHKDTSDMSEDALVPHTSAPTSDGAPIRSRKTSPTPSH